MEPGIREQVPVQREVLPQNSYETPTFGIDGGNLEKQNTSKALCAGVMTPGIQISADALFRNAAQLPSMGSGSSAHTWTLRPHQARSSPNPGPTPEACSRMSSFLPVLR